jgi:hypothetical protein
MPPILPALAKGRGDTNIGALHALSFTVSAVVAAASAAIAINRREYVRREWSVADGTPPARSRALKELTLGDGDELLTSAGSG